ncbi:aminotransferase class I/II-fold pyridoxal phosphate-dependent enzyme [Streptomyces sp. NPDC005263]|uniref:aminotransferase class I/II-fold pyridoxal phosphate-dependent enzyme n=1 Tax=Streptomyces sp. NPDC005263 TaxID=3364711 RepID=UPI003698A8E1
MVARRIGCTAPPWARSHRSTPRLARLEDAVREWLRPEGVPVDNVTFAHGALDLIGRLLSVELRPGDGVAMEDPGYHHLLDLVAALGLRVVPVAVDDEGVRPDELREALHAGVRALVCSPRAQNPYGGRFSTARRDELVAVLRDRPDVLVVENDHASAVAQAPLRTLAGHGLPRWVHVRTVSKFLGTDLRWAAAACDATTLARHDRRLLLTSGWVSHLLQETVLGLMTDEDTRALVARAEERYGVRRSAALRELRERGIEAHGASGMNLWVPVRDESAVVNGLRSHGWWVAAGARFRTAAGPGVRISVSDLEPADAVRLASDFAGVLGESEATYGG